MGNNGKGKKRVDQGKSSAQSASHSAPWVDDGPPDLSLPSPAQELSPEPKPIRLIEQINMNDIRSPNAPSPKSLQGGDAWETQEGNDQWGTQGRADDWDEDGTAAGQDDAWGEHETDNGNSGSRTRTSPSARASVSLGQPHNANMGGGLGISPQGLTSALMGLARFGARTEPELATTGEPTLKRKGTLQKLPSAAHSTHATGHRSAHAVPPPPPSQQPKRVAFGLSDLLQPPTDPKRAVASPLPALPVDTHPAAQMNRQIPSRNQSQGGWGMPQTMPGGFGGFPEPHVAQNHAGNPNANLHYNPAMAANPMVASARAPSMSALPQAAWMQWGNEAAKKFGMPQVATAVAASVPAASAPPAHHAPPPPAPPLPGGPMLGNGVADPRQAQLSMLQAMLAQKAALSRATATPMSGHLGVPLPGQVHLGPRPPAAGPTTPQATWKHLKENGQLPQSMHARQSQAQAGMQVPRPPQMEHANSWGQEWAPGGGPRMGVNPATGMGGQWGDGPEKMGGGGWATGADEDDGWGDTEDDMYGGKPSRKDTWEGTTTEAWGGGGDASGWGGGGDARGGKKPHHSHKSRGRSDHRRRDSVQKSPGRGWGPDVGAGEWDQSGGSGWDPASTSHRGGGWDDEDTAAAGGSNNVGSGDGWGDPGNAGDDHNYGQGTRKSKKKDFGGDDWGHGKHGKGASSKGHGEWDEWDVIPEEPEEEYDEEDEEYEDEDEGDLDSMYTEPINGNTNPQATNPRRNAHISPRISYLLQSPHKPPGVVSGAPTYGTHASPLPPGLPPGLPQMHPRRTHSTPTLPDPGTSHTMNFATGRMNNVFTLLPPKPGTVSHIYPAQGGALEPASHALYGHSRPAKQRIYWAFNPQKDPRVWSLIRWVEAMSQDLAIHGLRKFLETGQRGALIANAELRVDAGPGNTQPAFDFITFEEAKHSWDRILQESIACYNPAKQVVVFVYLLSKSGNSMAIWRRKCPIPEPIRAANKGVIDRAVSRLNTDEVIYVDEIRNKSAPTPVEQPKKKKKSWWRRFFGVFKRKSKSKS